MGDLVAFPPDRSADPPIARMRCDECGGAAMVFVPAAPRIFAFCGPECAAGCGVDPLALADLVTRSTWRTRAELEATA